MTCATTVETWSLDRGDTQWVGPIVVTLTKLDGTVLPISSVTFAVVPLGARAGSGDYGAPAANPDGGSAVGVTAVPVTNPGTWGIWAKAVNGGETVILGPDDVGRIRRT